MTGDRPAATCGADRGYAICTSPRSGSNLLCQYLASTGVLGRPLEYFNGPGRRTLGLPDYPDDREKQIACVLTIGATANGIYGLKIFPEQFDLVAASLSWTRLLPDLRFVLLKRGDLLAQAISSVRASQTKQWRSTSPAQGSAVYDADEIYERLRALVRDYARWDLFFARNGIDPLVVSYESLVESPQGCVDRIAGLFGLQGPALIDARLVDLAIQRDALSAEWKTRFLAERHGLDALDPL
jgi:LPS sulfotransferase NodH